MCDECLLGIHYMLCYNVLINIQNWLVLFPQKHIFRQNKICKWYSNSFFTELFIIKSWFGRQFLFYLKVYLYLMEILNIIHLICVNFTLCLSMKDVVRPVRIKIVYRKMKYVNWKWQKEMTKKLNNYFFPVTFRWW